MLSKTETLNHKLHCLFKYEVLLTPNFELVEQILAQFFNIKDNVDKIRIAESHYFANLRIA